MRTRIGIVGIGTTGFRATTKDVSYRELTYEAATKAYIDGGVNPKAIDAFISTAEDLHEGYSIADEYSPDQLGAVLKPIHTVGGDFLQSLGNACMMISAGDAEVMAVQGLSKASNMMTPHDVTTFALDPIYTRELRESPYFIAGLEMSRYLHESGNTREQCAQVVVKNRHNALANPRAAYGCPIEIEQVLNSEPVAAPLSRMDISARADGAVVIVVASEEAIKRLNKKPVWIKGISWMTETPNLETRNWGSAEYAKLAAKRAYSMAGIQCPAKEIDFAEVNDEFSYKELQHLEALGIFAPGQAGPATANGLTAANGEFPVNVSGGSLGMGACLDLDGGQRLYEAVLQLRGHAGAAQIEDANNALVCSWRSIPLTTGAVAVLGN